MNLPYFGPRTARLMGAAFLLFLPYLASAQGSDKNYTETHPERIFRLEATISVKKRVFHPGDVLEIQLELSNTGSDAIFVRKDIGFNSCANASIRIFSYYGAEYPGSGKDCANNDWPSDSNAPNPLTNGILHRDWLSLPPGKRYSRNIRTFPLGKPGRYSIRAVYSSDPLWKCKEKEYDCGEVFAPLFIGQLSTNSIWIEVVSKS